MELLFRNYPEMGSPQNPGTEEADEASGGSDEGGIHGVSEKFSKCEAAVCLPPWRVNIQ